MNIDELPRALGFLETEEMAKIRARWIAVLLGKEQGSIPDIVEQYHRLAEKVVDSYGDDLLRQKAQIGLLVKMALARRDGGLADDYLEDLKEAQIDAQQKSFVEVAIFIRDTIRSLQAKTGG